MRMSMGWPPRTTRALSSPKRVLPPPAMIYPLTFLARASLSIVDDCCTTVPQGLKPNCGRLRYGPTKVGPSRVGLCRVLRTASRDFFRSRRVGPSPFREKTNQKHGSEDAPLQGQPVKGLPGAHQSFFIEPRNYHSPEASSSASSRPGRRMPSSRSFSWRLWRCRPMVAAVRETFQW
jgi:hypothetical protein